MKVYIHERNDLDGLCQFGWAENDTMAPNQVRHECNEVRWHGSGPTMEHICTCGLVEVQ